MTDVDAQRLYETLREMQVQIGDVNAKVSELLEWRRTSQAGDTDRETRLRKLEDIRKNVDDLTTALPDLQGRVRSLEDDRLRLMTLVAMAGAGGGGVAIFAEKILAAFVGG